MKLRFLKAAAAFLRVWFRTGDCTHANLDLRKGSSYCPDCGYYVTIKWNMLSCRHCQARRLPKPSVFGPIRPQELFCKHCGHDSVQLVKKDRIEAYELPFAVSELHTEYDPQETKRRHPYVGVPFAARTHPTADDEIIDAEILDKFEVSGSTYSYKRSSTKPYASSAKVFQDASQEASKDHWQPHTHAWHNSGVGYYGKAGYPKVAQATQQNKKPQNAKPSAKPSYSQQPQQGETLGQSWLKRRKGKKSLIPINFGSKAAQA